ncbi:putative oxidoreductase [Escherichia coli]|uniref:Putative oxidoreductase n=1 Tax=Escherichia coli TaxID=562 RepID=A0A377K822_ECOLX|nr:putative oxidoreductase [Escherichia coli]
MVRSSTLRICANGVRSGGQGVVHKPIPGWQSTLEQRGFVGCARHFIECVQNQTVPQTAGEQAVLAQRIVDKIWRDAMSE